MRTQTILRRRSLLLPLLFAGVLSCGMIGEDPAPAPSSSADDWREAFLESVNAVRARGCRCGGRRMPPVAPLRWDDKLEAAARRHARDMARNSHFDHTGTDGSDVGQRARAAGFRWNAIAENIAWGYEDGAAVVAGWLKSPGHCRNMMGKDYTNMGVAQDDTYWVQVLGRR